MNSLIKISVKSSLFILISAVLLLFIQNSCTDIAGTDSFELGPGIKSVIPARGPLGAEITINGEGFGISASDVQLYFNSSKASIESLRDTTIFTRVPKDAKSGTIQVIVNGDTLAGPAFTVDTTKTLFLNIEKVTPLAGSPGEVVDIAGTGFKSVPVQNKVFFNDAAAVVKSASDTLLKAVVPSDAKTGNISVVVEQDTAQGPIFTVDAQGTLQVKISTTGENQDENGYLLAIDDSEGARTKTTDTITQSALEEGLHKIQLSDIASNCTLINDAENPRKVEIISGKITTTEYDISCEKENVKPVASFTYTCENLNCKFDASNSNDSDGNIASYAWEFGDGTNGTGKTLNHSYELADSYTAKLTVTDNEGAKASTSKKVSVTIPNVKSLSPSSGPRGTEVVISGSGFSANKPNNKVTFTSGSGEVNASIKSAAETKIVVDVPGDATSGPIYVSVNGYRVEGPIFTVVLVMQPKSLRVITQTENSPSGFDGYTLSVSGKDTRFINPNDERTINNIFDDQVDVELSGVPDICSVAGNNPRSVALNEPTTTTTFSITCTSPAPTINNISPESGVNGTEVTISGSNFSVTASENDVRFNGQRAELNNATPTELIAIVPGDATTGMVEVTVDGQTAQGPTFTVVSTGTLEINIATTGPDQDPNGYDLIFDSGDPSSVDINDVVTFNSVGEGSHSIELADIASNCIISQDRANPYNVNVTAGETTTTDIDVVCEEKNQPPVASFTYTCENLYCDFSGSGSTDPDGSIESYAWNYGDYGRGSGATSTHGYELPGTYTVKLTVTDNKGASNSTSKDITVTNPQVSGISPNSGPIGTEVTITGSGFSADKSDDKVLFTSGGGKVNATIKSASETQIVVDVPGDATTGPVYVSTYGYRVSGPTFTVEQPGALKINTAIEGTELDTDGYTVAVSGKGSKTISNTGSVTFNQIYDSSVQVELTGVAANCRADGDNPRTVAIAEGDLVSTSFNVDCTRDLRGQIIYLSDPDGNNDIFARDEQGNQIQQITETGSYEYLPKLSPDGLKIAYLDYAGGRQIFTIDSDGSDVQQITNSGYYSSFDWSPDGSKFVVSRSDNSDAPADIYTMDIDGGNLQNVTNTSTDYESRPDWSPNGDRIIYEIYKDGDVELYTIKTNGNNKVQLTNNSISDTEPEWSPDGTKIAFVRDVSGTGKIHIMNADGTGVYELTPSSLNEDSPTWSPDGLNMAYASYYNGNYSINIFSVAYDDILYGSSTPTNDISPHWNY